MIATKDRLKPKLLLKLNRAIKAESPKSKTLQPWPNNAPSAPANLKEVWRSADFLVQVYDDENVPGVQRLSICRTSVATNGHWSDRITWDDLQRLKDECGRGDRQAVEIYPANEHVVNVANLRHLWVLPLGTSMPFAWRKKGGTKVED